MKTTRQLRLERLSTAAANTGEQSASVLELVTFFNAFYEERCEDDGTRGTLNVTQQNEPIDGFPRCSRAVLEDEERAIGEQDAIAIDVPDEELLVQGDTGGAATTTEGAAIKKTVLGAALVEVPKEEAPQGAAEDAPATTAVEALKIMTWTSLAVAVQALAQSTKFRHLYALGACVKTNVFKAAHRVCGLRRRKHDNAGVTEDAIHDDEALAALLRLAIEMEDARSNANASRAMWRMNTRQLAAVRARLRAFQIDGNTSATARRFHEALTAIASDALDEPYAVADTGAAQAWV